MADAGMCPSCGETIEETARFCEACGQDLATPPVVRLATSATPPATCANCAGTEFAEQPEGGSYCENCGTRRPSGADHSEIDLGGAAGVSDIGRRHHHNEDAMGVAILAGASVGVVCDGVSSSNRPDTAAQAAVDAATRTLARLLADGTAPDSAIAESAMLAAVGSAQAAAAQVGNRNSGPNPPSATFVAAVVTSDAITVGWIGDSRAYWLPDAGPAAAMTIDDSLGGQLAAAGVEVSDDAPNLAALVRWLGADATDTAPHIAVFRPAGPGRVIVCSDGLYRYAADAADLATRTPTAPPIDVAQSLVQFALESGGQDNVTVLVVPYPPREGS